MIFLQNKKERNSSKVFPQAPASLDFEQLGLFEYLEIMGAKRIKGASNIIKLKLKYEDKLQSAATIPSFYVGAVVHTLLSNEDIERIVEMYGVDKEKLLNYCQRAIPIVKPRKERLTELGIKEPSKRAKEFLEKF